MRTQIELWKENVYDNASEIDPNDKHLWESLALGYFLGLRMSLEEAQESVELADKEGLI